MTSVVPGGAGWYSDPAARFDSRYFDGTNWTSAVKRGEEVESDPEAIQVEFTVARGSAIPTIPPPPKASEPRTVLRVAAPEWPRGAAGDRQTPLPLTEAQREVVRVLALAGVRVQNQQPGLIQASVPLKGRPNLALAFLLGLAWVIPGVIYVISASRTRMLPAAIHLTSSSTGATDITIHADPAPRQAVLSALAAVR
jgi:hypothetical protein